MSALYQLVFANNATPTEQQLEELTKSLAALPGNIFNAVHQHYINGKPVNVIAEETGNPPQLIETWLKSGVALLKVFHQVPLNSHQ